MKHIIHASMTTDPSSLCDDFNLKRLVCKITCCFLKNKNTSCTIWHQFLEEQCSILLQNDQKVKAVEAVKGSGVNMYVASKMSVCLHENVLMFHFVIRAEHNAENMNGIEKFRFRTKQKTELNVPEHIDNMSNIFQKIIIQ